LKNLTPGGTPTGRKAGLEAEMGHRLDNKQVSLNMVLNPEPPPLLRLFIEKALPRRARVEVEV
jgi:hypothetical protein